MSEVRRVLLANGQYIEIVQETGTSTGSVMSQSAVTTALNRKANSSHTHVASDITSGTFGEARIANGAITSGKLAANSVTTDKVADGAITRAKLASDVPISVTQYETVTVTGVCSDGSSIAGKQLSIGGYLYEFDGNGVVSANIPYGQAYTIRPTVNNLYFSNDFYTFTASTASRSVTMNYSLISYGAYIEDKQGRLYTTSDWSSGNNANVNSIAVFTPLKNFRIASVSATMKEISAGWNINYGTKLESFISSTGASLDYDGAYNTQQIISLQPSTDYAAGWCNAYTFPDGVTKGYLPSLGELVLADNNYGAIMNAFDVCGGYRPVYNNYYWSSTFYAYEQYGSYWDSFFWRFQWGMHEDAISNNNSLDKQYILIFGAY